VAEATHSQTKRFDGKKALALPGEPRAKLVSKKTQAERGGVHESESVIPVAPKNAAPDNADQLDQAGQTILKLLHKAAGVAEANSKQALDMARNSRISFARPKVGLRSWRARLRLIRRNPSALNNGSTKSTRRLRTDFCGNT
jgi:hypothetical protein